MWTHGILSKWIMYIRDGTHDGDSILQDPKNPNPSLEWYYGIQFHPQDISG